MLVIGNAPAGEHSRGGMASVVRLMDRSAAADPGIDLTVVPTYRDVGTAGRILTAATGIWRSCRRLLGGRVDVLHVHLSHGGSVARKALPIAAARRSGVPVVVHAHSFNFATWFDALPAPARPLVRRVVRADRFVVLSASQGDVYTRLLRLDPAAVEVLANPASLPAADGPKPERDDDRTVAVFLGRYGERKGIADLVAAVARLAPEDRARLRLVTAGDGDIEQVRTDVAALDLGDVVEVRRWISPSERDELLSGAHVFVLPSYDEALPMALIEAMAFRLVPVVTPVGAMPDLVRDGDNGLVVGTGEPAQLAAALHTLLSDPGRRRALGQRARDSVETLDAAAWWGRLVTLWEDLAVRRPAPGPPATPPPPAPR